MATAKNRGVVAIALTIEHEGAAATAGYGEVVATTVHGGAVAAACHGGVTQHESMDEQWPQPKIEE